MLADGLDSMGRQLHDYIQYQKQFVSNVSHELKHPWQPFVVSLNTWLKGRMRTRNCKNLWSPAAGVGSTYTLD